MKKILIVLLIIASLGVTGCASEKASGATIRHKTTTKQTAKEATYLRY